MLYSYVLLSAFLIWNSSITQSKLLKITNYQLVRSYKNYEKCFYIRLLLFVVDLQDHYT